MLIYLIATVLAGPFDSPRSLRPSSAPTCKPEGALTRIDGLYEGSGVAVNRDGTRLWTHNDSGVPVVFSLDTSGKVVRKTTISGARIEDWEAMAAGPCPGGTCVYIADIGDNDAQRKQVTIYRVAEAELEKERAAVRDVFHATYPDGAHDAEALLIDATGTMFIVTKGDTGPIALYRFPRTVQSGRTHTLERVGSGAPGRDKADRITDGSVSPDGKWVALRSNGTVYMHAASDFLAGTWNPVARIDVATLREPQGEGIAFVNGSTLVLIGEGGGKKQPGTMARLSCTF